MSWWSEFRDEQDGDCGNPACCPPRPRPPGATWSHTGSGAPRITFSDGTDIVRYTYGKGVQWRVFKGEGRQRTGRDFDTFEDALAYSGGKL